MSLLTLSKLGMNAAGVHQDIERVIEDLITRSSTVLEYVAARLRHDLAHQRTPIRRFYTQMMIDIVDERLVNPFPPSEPQNQPEPSAEPNDPW